jgi:hypothetical protein
MSRQRKLSKGLLPGTVIDTQRRTAIEIVVRRFSSTGATMAKKNRKPNIQKRKTAQKPKLMQAVEAFIEHNPTIIAALAWAGYQQEGRGFVLVAIEESGGLDASYIGERDELWPTIQPDFPEITELTSAYDPKREVVVVSRVPDYVQMGIAEFDVPPPIAYVKHQDDIG